jgi:hypothetical protein
MQARSQQLCGKQMHPEMHEVAGIDVKNSFLFATARHAGISRNDAYVGYRRVTNNASATTAALCHAAVYVCCHAGQVCLCGDLSMLMSAFRQMWSSGVSSGASAMTTDPCQPDA